MQNTTNTPTEERKPLSVEELMKPRYKVIADYPEAEYLVGKVITFSHKESWFSEKAQWVTDMILHKDGGSYGSRPITYFEPFPHIFQLLQWWEEREEWMMPEYVKRASEYIRSPYEAEVRKLSGLSEWRYKYWLPATLEEYNSQSHA